MERAIVAALVDEREAVIDRVEACIGEFVSADGVVDIGALKRELRKTGDYL